MILHIYGTDGSKWLRKKFFKRCWFQYLCSGLSCSLGLGSHSSLKLYGQTDVFSESFWWKKNPLFNNIHLKKCHFLWIFAFSILPILLVMTWHHHGGKAKYANAIPVWWYYLYFVNLNFDVLNRLEKLISVFFTS